MSASCAPASGAVWLKAVPQSPPSALAPLSESTKIMVSSSAPAALSRSTTRPTFASTFSMVAK
jgi:hypothetical protein